MKRLKGLLSFLLVLLLLSALPLAAAAEEAAAEPAPDWDTIVQDLIAGHNAYDTQVGVGYLNLVTGEEHYLNPDTFMGAASMFKLPLCMYFTEQMQSGQIVWDAEAMRSSYKDVQDRVLLDSSNEDAQILWEQLGGFAAFRSLTAAYMGAEPEDMAGEVSQYNLYTPRHFIACLRLLYTERERFPDVLETMLQATPDHYFRMSENRYDIAHKFGYVPVTAPGEDLLTNDCGIIFTSQPFALVVFTSNVAEGEQLLADFCTAMCDYTEAMAARSPSAPEPSPEAESAAGTAPPAEPTPVPAAESPAPSSLVPASLSSALPELPSELPLVPLGCVLLFAVLGIIAILRFCVRYRARFFTLLLSLLLSAAAMLLSITGLYSGTVYAKPDGDPAETVAVFFDNLCAGRYEAACGQLRDYADLGLGDVPSTAAGRAVYDALHQSFSYKLVGAREIRMLDAAQRVRFRYLALPSIDGDVAAEAKHQIEEIVESRSASEVYDEDRHYLPAVTDEAYLAALETVLAHAEDYYTETEFALSLTYTDGRWQILMNPELLRALSGGIGA